MHINPKRLSKNPAYSTTFQVFSSLHQPGNPPCYVSRPCCRLQMCCWDHKGSKNCCTSGAHLVHMLLPQMHCPVAARSGRSSLQCCVSELTALSPSQSWGTRKNDRSHHIQRAVLSPWQRQNSLAWAGMGFLSVKNLGVIGIFCMVQFLR